MNRRDLFKKLFGVPLAAGIAQLGEPSPCKRQVAGSTPAASHKGMKWLPHLVRSCPYCYIKLTYLGTVQSYDAFEHPPSPCSLRNVSGYGDSVPTVIRFPHIHINVRRPR